MGQCDDLSREHGGRPSDGGLFTLHRLVGGGGLTAQKSHLMSPTAKRNDENKTIACNDNDTIQSKRFILKGEKNKKQNKLQATNERKNKRKMIQKHKRKKKKVF